MTDATYRSVNRAGWDQLTVRGSHSSRAYGPEQFAHARQLLDPAGWFPWRSLRTVLCLAGGGGQQGPLFASLGYEVTVVDLSPEQLEQDRATARRHGLTLDCVEADMQDLSALPQGPSIWCTSRCPRSTCPTSGSATGRWRP